MTRTARLTAMPPSTEAAQSARKIVGRDEAQQPRRLIGVKRNSSNADLNVESGVGYARKVRAGLGDVLARPMRETVLARNKVRLYSTVCHLFPFSCSTSPPIYRGG